MKVIHYDRLKPYVGEPLKPWTVGERVIREVPLVKEVITESASDDGESGLRVEGVEVCTQSPVVQVDDARSQSEPLDHEVDISEAEILPISQQEPTPQGRRPQRQRRRPQRYL